MAGLKLVGVNKIYPSGALALRGINLELKDKEFIAVVGGEKSGKSTLLKIIAGLEEVSDGQVIIDDKDVTEVDPKDRNIAMIFRNDTLYPVLNIFENMAYGLRLRKAPQAVIEQRVKSAAAILGLEDCLYKKPKTLTAAQRQKAAIGRAIVREPRLYLFDDPIAGLDGDLKAQVRNVIVNLQARMNGTFIYATKNVNEALTMATRIVVLREGFVQQIDTPANLYDYPENAYVAFLVGSPTINFVNKAHIEKREDKYLAVCGNFEVELSEKIISRFEKIEEYAETGKEIIIGLRPEDLTAGENGVPATVSSSEEIDGRTFADCDLEGGLSLVIYADGKAKGDKVNISYNPDRVYLFDGETRLTLLSRDDGYEKTEFADAAFKPLDFNEEERIRSLGKPEVKAKGKKK